MEIDLSYSTECSLKTGDRQDQPALEGAYGLYFVLLRVCLKITPLTSRRFSAMISDQIVRSCEKFGCA